MKKVFLAVTALALLSIGVKAQSKSQGPTFGIGLNLALPTGNFGTAYSFGIGGTAQVEIPFTDNIKGIGSIGYTSFLGKTESFTYVDPISGNSTTSSAKVPSSGLIPILVGARFFPSEQFFVGAQIGVGFLSASGGGGSSSGFAYLPQVGYVAGPLEFSLGYSGVSVTGGTVSSLQLGAVYTFGGN